MDSTKPNGDDPSVVPTEIKKLLDCLPGMTGAIDQAFQAETGQPWPFVLLVFSGDKALHVTNFEPAEAMRLIKHFAEALK
jgi:hypothetical protein